MSGLPCDRRRLARDLTLVENRAEEAESILSAAWANGRAADVVGISGPPGAGKSTLIDELAVRWSDAGRTVAILAADPASPFTGGALLGDRVRMHRLGERPNIYLRSLSVRRAAGGLAETTADLCAVLRARGFDLILLEAVGAGQSETAVADLADCVVAVSVPGLGDLLQAEKAGLLEAADVHAVNKADLSGAQTTLHQLRLSLSCAYSGEEGLRTAADTERPSVVPRAHGPIVSVLTRRHGDIAHDATTWRPPVLAVSALRDEGLEELCAAVEGFLDWQRVTGRLKARRASRLANLIDRHLRRHVVETVMPASCHDLVRLLDEARRAVEAGQLSPDAAAAQLCATILQSRAAAAAQIGPDLAVAAVEEQP